MTLPNKLRERLEIVASDMSTDELVELSIACAQANAIGEDVFAYASSITAVVVDRMIEASGDDILKLLIAFKQCRSVGVWAMGADFNTGVLSALRKEMEKGDPHGLIEWFEYDWNLRGFAAGMEDAAAVLASPGILQALEFLAAQWKEKMEDNPEEAVTYVDALKTYRRIADAYKALIPAAELWNAPADTHASLVASIAAAKHKEAAGDAAGVAAQASGLISNFESMLNNPEALAPLVQDQELMSSWMDSYVIMGAVWNSETATEALLESEVFRKELFNPDGVGNGRVGLQCLMDDYSAFQNIVASVDMTDELCQSQAACKTLFGKPGAYTQLFESESSYKVPFKYPHASAAILDNRKICKAYVHARYTHPSIYGSFGILDQFFDSENMCEAIFDVPTVFASILHPKARRMQESMLKHPVARKVLFSYSRYYHQFLESPSACVNLFKNTDAFKEAFANRNVLEAIFESDAAVETLSMSEIAIEELTRNHNPELQEHRDLIAATVRNNSSNILKKVYEGADSAVANLNAIVATYPNSLVIATLGYATTATDSTTMIHKNGVTAATGSDVASPQTVSTVSGISFTGCTFTEQGDGHAAIEVWQAK